MQQFTSFYETDTITKQAKYLHKWNINIICIDLNAAVHVNVVSQTKTLHTNLFSYIHIRNDILWGYNA